MQGFASHEKKFFSKLVEGFLKPFNCVTTSFMFLFLFF